MLFDERNGVYFKYKHLCGWRSLLLPCRFRPISAAETMSQSIKPFQSVAGKIDERRRAIVGHNIAPATLESSFQPPPVITTSSRTVLLPSPSSAFSAPPTRSVDTVPPTADDTVPSSLTTQCHASPDMECRYRRRGTVREMAQSYDRAAQNQVSTRRLSYSFRPTLPTTTNTSSASGFVAKPSQVLHILASVCLFFLANFALNKFYLIIYPSRQATELAHCQGLIAFHWRWWERL